jgi:hypothetical protein
MASSMSVIAAAARSSQRDGAGLDRLDAILAQLLLGHVVAVWQALLMFSSGLRRCGC